MAHSRILDVTQPASAGGNVASTLSGPSLTKGVAMTSKAAVLASINMQYAPARVRYTRSSQISRQ
jgi:hypothetical protein